MEKWWRIMNKFLICFLLTAPLLVFASSREEQILLCSSNARAKLKANITDLNPPKVTLVNLTTWLSRDSGPTSPREFNFAHIAIVKLQDESLMQWDFASLTKISGELCILEKQIKTYESKFPPGEACENCEDGQD